MLKYRNRLQHGLLWTRLKCTNLLFLTPRRDHSFDQQSFAVYFRELSFLIWWSVYYNRLSGRKIKMHINRTYELRCDIILTSDGMCTYRIEGPLMKVASNWCESPWSTQAALQALRRQQHAASAHARWPRRRPRARRSWPRPPRPQRPWPRSRSSAR